MIMHKLIKIYDDYFSFYFFNFIFKSRIVILKIDFYALYFVITKIEIMKI
jgi:hypothetical protein